MGTNGRLVRTASQDKYAYHYCSHPAGSSHDLSPICAHRPLHVFLKTGPAEYRKVYIVYTFATIVRLISTFATIRFAIGQDNTFVGFIGSKRAEWLSRDCEFH